MRVREATLSESDFILRHRMGMFTAMGASEEELSETRRLTEEFIKTDWTSFYRYFLLELEDEIIGGCGVSTFALPPQASQKTGVYGYISNMFVEQPHQGKGYGRALMRHVINICKKEDIGLLILHSSERGHSLYESEGFMSSKALMHLLVSKLEANSSA